MHEVQGCVKILLKPGQKLALGTIYVLTTYTLLALCLYCISPGLSRCFKIPRTCHYCEGCQGSRPLQEVFVHSQEIVPEQETLNKTLCGLNQQQ